MIRKLDAESVRLLGSTEVVVSPASVVKELAENAIDSGATRITIKMDDFGLGSIEVADNGCGIPAQSMPLIGERHCTSKSKSGVDLIEGKVETYGFRGEALASIATVAGHLSIATCCPDEAQGRRYLFDQNTSHFATPPTVVAMQSGTVVTVLRLFEKLPVRRDYYAKSKQRCRETLALCRQIVAGLSLSRLNCRFSLKHTGNATSLWETATNLTVPTVLALIAGPLVKASDFEHFKVDQLVDEHQLEFYLPPAEKCSPDRQSLLFRSGMDSLFICVNNRPIQDKDLAGAVKSAYVECGILSRGAFPIGCLKLTVSRHLIDANVDVAKQLVYFGAGKDAIVEAVKTKVAEFLSVITQRTNKVAQIADQNDAATTEDVEIDCDDDDEPISKKPRRQGGGGGVDADLWSRGRAIREDQQPVQLLMPLDEPPPQQIRKQQQSNWVASLMQLHQQRRKRSEIVEKPPSPAELQSELLFQEVEETSISLSERLSIAMEKWACKLTNKKQRQLPEEVAALIATRPSEHVSSIGSQYWLGKLKAFFAAPPTKKNPISGEFKEIGQIGGIMLLIDVCKWSCTKQLQNSLIAMSLRRLSEAALFASMMASAQLAKRNLGHNFSLARFLTPAQLQFLASLPSKPSNPPLFNAITDPRLVANGFKLRVYPTPSRPPSLENLNGAASCYVEVEASPELPEPYNLTTPNVIGPVVAEIVEAMMETAGAQQHMTGVAACRPGIIVDYLRSEIDRLLMLKTGDDDDHGEDQLNKEGEFLQQILSNGDRHSLLSIQCPHSKPLFYWPIIGQN